MQLHDAIELIKKGVPVRRSVWADLGCGEGLFTRALAELISKGSSIYAVDSNRNALNKINNQYNEVLINKLECNFIQDDITTSMLDGLLMANSLHFVPDKKLFLKKIDALLQPLAHIVIVEYDLAKANQWVPYPLQFSDLANLFSTIGFSEITKIGEIPSVYHHSSIYSALLKKQPQK